MLWHDDRECQIISISCNHMCYTTRKLDIDRQTFCGAWPQKLSWRISSNAPQKSSNFCGAYRENAPQKLELLWRICSHAPQKFQFLWRIWTYAPQKAQVDPTTEFIDCTLTNIL